MIDFWELAGRLMLMEPGKRKTEIYEPPDGRLKLQPPCGCLLPGHETSPTLPFKALDFYNPLRGYFLGTAALPGIYRGQMLAPVISMYALGEIGAMFFNQKFRDRFESLSKYLRERSVIKGRTDTGFQPVFYIALAVIAMDTAVRATVAAPSKDFQQLPVLEPDATLLHELAKAPEFVKEANQWCFGDLEKPAAERGDDDAPWTPGSDDALNVQKYPPIEAEGSIQRDYRHVRFLGLP